MYEYDSSWLNRCGAYGYDGACSYRGSLTTAQGTKPRHFLDVATAHPTERTGSGRGAGMGILGAPG